jgi:hypothetical protein
MESAGEIQHVSGADREEEIGSWLEDRHIRDARQLAPSLVDAGSSKAVDTVRG